MSFDRDPTDDRLDVASVRESLAERVDVDAAVERIGDAADPASLRARLDDLYVRYFMPPSVTGDAVDEAALEAPDEAAVDPDSEPFDFESWLRAGRATGPRKPPLEPRVVTDAAALADPVDAGAVDEAFDFADWLADGEAFEPVTVREPDAEVSTDQPTAATSADGPLLPRPSLSVHPVKAATYALFLSVVALVALTAGGALPALGPATGLGP